MDDWDRVISFGALYDGLQKAQRNVVWKDSVSGYSLDGLENTQAEAGAGGRDVPDQRLSALHDP